MGHLARYLNRMVLVRFGVLLLTVAGFAVLLDLLDVGSRVVRRLQLQGDGFSLLWYSIYRLPSLVTDLVPLVALVAALLTTLDLVRHRELVIAWASGLSRAGIVVRVLPVALLLAGLKLAIDDAGVPGTVPMLRALGAIEFARTPGPGEAFLWLRHGKDVLRVPRDILAEDGSATDILVFRRDEAGRLLDTVRARRLAIQPERWRLLDVTRQPASSEPATRIDDLVLPIGIPLERLRLLARPAREVGILDLGRIVLADGFGVTEAQAQKAWLHGRLAVASTTALLVLLGLALVPRYRRGPVAFGVLARGLAIGLTATMIQGVGLALAEDGLVPAVLGAWLAPLLLAVVIWALVTDGLRRRGVPVAAAASAPG